VDRFAPEDRMMGKEIFRCEACPATYAHASATVDAETLEVEEECPTTEGICAHLHAAGWRTAWVRVTVDKVHIFSRGGWLCADCVGRYLPRPRRGRGKK
jgi:hypothetical protein